MKTFLTLIAFLAISQAQANTTPLKTGDLAITAASAKIISVTEICPQNPGLMACMAVGSKVKIQVTMNGCLDRLGGYYSTFIKPTEGSAATLRFTALNIANQGSETARCIAANTKMVEVYVPYVGKIKLEAMDYVGKNLEVLESSTELLDGDLSLSKAQVEVVSVKPVCDSSTGMACMAFGSMVELKITLNGCMDRLGGVVSTYDSVNNKFSFAALNIANKSSMSVMCYAAPTEFVSVYVPANVDVKLEEIEYVGAKSQKSLIFSSVFP